MPSPPVAHTFAFKSSDLQENRELVARINTVAFQGISVRSIDVQVTVSGGQVTFALVGLPDKAVGESKERVRAALHALGLSADLRSSPWS